MGGGDFGQPGEAETAFKRQASNDAEDELGRQKARLNMLMEVDRYLEAVTK